MIQFRTALGIAGAFALAVSLAGTATAQEVKQNAKPAAAKTANVANERMRIIDRARAATLCGADLSTASMHSSTYVTFTRKKTPA